MTEFDPPLELTVGMTQAEYEYDSEKQLVLYYYDAKNDEMVNLKETLDPKDYDENGGRYFDSPHSHKIRLHEWGDPNVGWGEG